MKIKQFLKGAILALALSALAAIVAAEFLMKATNVAVDRLKWKNAPQLITLFDMQREGGKQGVLFLRLKDAKTQFIAGEWDVDFAENGSAYAFGRFPQGYASTSEHLFVLANSGRIFDLPLKNVSGRVTSVRGNRNGSYLLIGSDGATTTHYCLMELSGSVPSCRTIALQNIENAKWRPDKEHELLFKTSSEAIYTVDPWEEEEKKPKAVSPEKDQETYQKLSGFFQDETRDPSANAAVHRPYWRLFGYLIVKTGSAWQLHRVPWLASIAWLDGGEHFLVKERGRVSVYELASHAIASLLEENGLGGKKILFHRNLERTL